MAVIAALVLVGLLYALTWSRLRRRSRATDIAAWEQLIGFLAGLLAVALALLSPLDALADRFFFVHMLQHEALMFVVPPLLLMGLAPFISLERSLASEHASLRYLTKPFVTFCLSTVVLWLWHIPAIYNFALNHQPVHDFEHLTFLGSFLLYWWPLMASSRSFTGNAPRMLYILAGATQCAALGGLIAFSDRVFYTHYLVTSHPGPFSPLRDQQLGGAVMLFSGPFVYGIAALLTIRG